MRIRQQSSSRKPTDKDTFRNPRHHHEESSRLLTEGKTDAALLASLQSVELMFSASAPTVNSWFVRHLLYLLIKRDMPHLADTVYEKATALGADRYLLSLQRARTLQTLRRKAEAVKELGWAVKNQPALDAAGYHGKIESYLKYLLTFK